VFAAFGGNRFGSYWGTFLTAFGAIFSCAILYGISLYVGNRFIRHWLSSNLPMTYKFLQSQGWKIVLATRFIPLFPYDLLSLLYGFFNFNWRYVLPLSFLASLPEIYIFANLASPTTTATGALVKTLTVVCLFFLSPGMIIEYRSRKMGSSMWVRLKQMWSEIIFEIRMTNIIIREKIHDPKKIPVFLVYGFFSSRKTLTILGHLLERRGYEVITFNLGGLFGVFSTKGIPESAEAINNKLNRYLKQHNIKKLNIIAHSKGGLVAFWWLLKLNGDQYCKKLITLGTPFAGTYLTWLGILSPLGMVMVDMWQMRPGSSFLAELKTMVIPKDLHIYNIYSDSDSIARGERGILKSDSYKQIQPIAMHHVYHEDFLKRRDVCDTLAYILGSPNIES
jgi:pimeloyl-ACP methyl ester carboxylesterase